MKNIADCTPQNNIFLYMVLCYWVGKSPFQPISSGLFCCIKSLCLFFMSRNMCFQLHFFSTILISLKLSQMNDLNVLTIVKKGIYALMSFCKIMAVCFSTIEYIAWADLVKNFAALRPLCVEDGLKRNFGCDKLIELWPDVRFSNNRMYRFNTWCFCVLCLSIIALQMLLKH